MLPSHLQCTLHFHALLYSRGCSNKDREQRQRSGWSQFNLSSHLGAFLLKELGVDLLADNLSADVVFNGYAQPHLLQDELHLLFLLHGAVRFHLQDEGKPLY